MARLTPSPKQAETPQHISSFIEEKGYSPTVAELAKLAGVRSFALQQRLDALEKKVSSLGPNGSPAAFALSTSPSLGGPRGVLV
ncbi:LexA family protein [Pseudomonas sp. TCU-HL1]|uniref:LexA family protein n=1 Tax=Pseudomonas sp. TCU-HL1 TaxID=1856685 RepID=UPI00083CC00C|nr:hypothetical protein THL1_3573 [Pseudomonas sp. TCU-HL1]